MNSAQRVVILIGLLLMALMGVYWPWYDATALLWSPVSTRYYSLFAPPDRNHAPDIPQLFAQWAVAAGITVGLVVWLRRRKIVASRAQLTALLVGALAILAMGMFPPWLADTELHPGEEMVFAGYHGPFTPPHKVYHPQWGVEPLGYGRVHAPLLALQWLLVGALTTAVVVGLGRRKPSPANDERSARAAMSRAERPAIVIGLLAIAAAVLLGLFAVRRSGEPRLPPAPATRQLHQRGPIPVRASFGVFLPDVDVFGLPADIGSVGPWSPDSKWLLAEDSGRLSKVDRQGNRVRLYSPKDGWYVTSVENAAWTDGGKRIWFEAVPPSCDDPGRELSVGDDGSDVRPRPWGDPTVKGDLLFQWDQPLDQLDRCEFKFYRGRSTRPFVVIPYQEILGALNSDVGTTQLLWLPDSSGMAWLRHVHLRWSDLRIIDLRGKQVIAALEKRYEVKLVAPLGDGHSLWLWLDADPRLGLDESFVHTAIWRRGQKRLEVRSYNLLDLGPPQRIWRLVPSPNQDYLLVYYQPEDDDGAIYALDWQGTTLQWICDGMLPHDLYPISPDGSAFVFAYEVADAAPGQRRTGHAIIDLGR